MKHVILVSCAALLCAAESTAFAQVRRPTRTGPPTLSTTTPTPAPTPAPALTLLTLSHDSISGGPGGANPPNGKVTLSAPAPAGGFVVTLASDNPAATVPQNITVPAGATERTFPVTTAAVPSPTPVRITATAGNSSVSDDLKLLLGIVSVVGEGWVAGTNATQRVYRVTMSGPAPPSGLKLMASLGVAHPLSGVCAPMPLFSYPIAVAAGANSGLLTITTDRSMLKQWYWEIWDGHRRWPQPQLTVMPAHVGLITIPSTITGGTTAYGTVQTAGGSTVTAACVAQNPTWYNHEYTVYFSSGNTALLQVPSSGLISPGQNQLSFAITASPVTTAQTATITASRRNNQGALVAVKQVTVTVTP